MGFWSRILGICRTRPPADAGCWSYAPGELTLDLDRAPELESPGGAIRLEGNGLPGRLLVVHGGDGRFHVFRNKCTHGGRRLDPLPGQEAIQCCSVGKSTFDYAGQKISGPAKGELTALPVDRQGPRLVIRVD
jgi:nitrite reductase/ring-hydroxylating ferredoxin subunit